MSSSSASVPMACLLAERVVPVLRYADAATAGYAAEIAVQAGCQTLELTWTIPGVTDLVRVLRDKHGDALTLGVGTVLDEAQARDALVAGADFLVAPGLVRSEEHTSELQSLMRISYAVFCMKKQK